MKTGFAGLLFAALMTNSAHAGLMEWSAEADEDPFNGSTKVAVDYMDSFRSGIAIFCDSSEDGLRIRVIPGFTFDQRMAGYEPTMEFAIDGERHGTVIGQTGSVGDNLAIAEGRMVGSQARNFARAFTKAQRQIAVKDGISNSPMLVKATGSTKSGNQILTCMREQSSWID